MLLCDALNIVFFSTQFIAFRLLENLNHIIHNGPHLKYVISAST